MHVLIIEDDHETAAFIERGLRERECSSEHCDSLESALLTAPSSRFDVIIFDRLLPGNLDGVDAVALLRKANVETPIIMLTALSGIEDRVSGLSAGADDYMVKPFAFEELFARLQALMRRKPMQPEINRIKIGDLSLDRTTQQVLRAGQEIDLSRREYKILDLLMMHSGELVTRTMLLEKIWGYGFDPKTSIVQTHVSRLRSKIDKPFDKELIKTVRGSGYMLSE
ncbi:MAG: response regulator transcription factor [Pseudomonadota bacterium]